MDKLSLYGAIDELDALELIVEELSDTQDQEMVLSRTNELIAYIQEKTDAVYYYNLSLDDQITAHDKLIKQLQESKKKLENKQDKFGEYALICMDKLRVKKLSGKFYNITYRTPSKKVEVYDEKIVPSEYVETKTIETKTILKDKAKEYLMLGAEIPGIRLIDSTRNLLYKVGK